MSTLDSRCPQCGALLRGDAAWCTLCHADLRPPPPAPEPAPAEPVVVLDPLTAPLEDVLAQAAYAPPPVAAAPGPDPVTAPAAGEVVVEVATERDAAAEQARRDELAELDDDVMFAMLRAQSQDPLLAKFGDKYSSKGSRAVFVVGAASLITIVLFGGFSLFGLLFG